MNKTIRVGVISFNCSHGLVYQRIHLPLMNLDSIDVRCFDLGDLRNSDAFYIDVFVISQPWLPEYVPLIQRIKHHFKKPVVLDIDDLATEMPADHPDYSAMSGTKVTQCVQLADHCVYSTKYLGSKFGHLNKDFTVIENTINEKVYQGYSAIAKPYQNVFTVGWTGGQSHRPDQPQMIPGLTQFLRENFDTRAYFHVLCPQSLISEFGTQIIYDPHVVDYLDYPAVSAAYPFSVCTVPLAPHPFNEAKSDLKLLEMAPHMIPLIASPRSEFIRHADKNIMLYADDTDPNYKTWHEQLSWVNENPEAMKEMAQRANDYVMRERVSAVAAAQWEQLLQSVTSL